MEVVSSSKGIPAVGRQSATLSVRQAYEGQRARMQHPAADCLRRRRRLADFHVLGAVALGARRQGISGVVEPDPLLALQALVDALPRFLACRWHCSPPFAGANSFPPQTSVVGQPDRNLRWTPFSRESPDEADRSSDCDVPPVIGRDQSPRSEPQPGPLRGRGRATGRRSGLRRAAWGVEHGAGAAECDGARTGGGYFDGCEETSGRHRPSSGVGASLWCIRSFEA